MMISIKKMIEHYDSLYRFYENEGDILMSKWAKNMKISYEASLNKQGKE